MPNLATKKDDVLFEWHAFESVKEERGRIWFLAVGFVTAVLAAIAAYTLNIMLLILLAVGAITIILLARREPIEYHFKITSSGIWVNREFIPFHALESFWIFDFPEKQILSLRPKSRASFGHHLALQKKDASEVKEILQNYLPEIEEEYSLIDWLSDWL